MHTSGVTHGEIKPENISVDSQGDIKITDLKLFRKP
jgi:serine/threonine protein kinase